MNVAVKILPSATSMQGGVASSAGSGQVTNVLLTGDVPTAGDVWTLLFSDNLTQNQVQVGAGTVTSLTPNFAFTFANKEYLLSGASTYFSAVGLPKTFNDPEADGNGYVTMSNYFSTPEDLVSIAPFQGRLAFFSRQTTYIWQVSADPDLWALQQIMQNVGTMAAQSVQPVGELDVFFLNDTGVRSLKARETTLNAYVDDAGSPIDSLIQGLLLLCPKNLTATSSQTSGTLTAGTYYYVVTAVVGGVETFPIVVPVTGTINAGVTTGRVSLTWGAVTGATSYKIYRAKNIPTLVEATLLTTVTAPTVTYIDTGTSTSAGRPPNVCSVVEPSSLRYWIYLNGKIYVLSRFQMGQVAAWSEYEPKDNSATPVTFVPEKFVVFKGQVYCRAGNIIYCYGGANNNTFDSTIAEIEIPWTDLKTPGTRKITKGIQLAVTGAWSVKGGMDTQTASLTSASLISAITGNSFDQGIIPWVAQGTHFKFNAVTTGATAAVFSGIVLHYDKGDEI